MTSFSHRQGGEDGVRAILQLVVGQGRVQLAGVLHREAELALLIQGRQLAPTAPGDQRSS